MCYIFYNEGGMNMNKKTRKILVWVMLFLMIASFLAGVIAYFLA